MAAELFEALMMIAFGMAWPFSIYKSLKAKSVKGKSLYFMVVVFLGYIFGILFKIFGNMDFVILLYVMNTLLVGADIVLYLKYRNN
ncbi:hypothetical protein KAH55_10130 [bacterium]|nr:hypothetical protein [bacterium]